VLDPGTPETNMIFMSLNGDIPDLDAQGVADRLLKMGVKVGAVGARRFRLVTHYWIDDADVDQAAAAFAKVLQTN
jgi:threonine aldolase